MCRCHGCLNRLFLSFPYWNRKNLYAFTMYHPPPHTGKNTRFCPFPLPFTPESGQKSPVKPIKYQENAEKCRKNAETFAYIKKRQYLCTRFWEKSLVGWTSTHFNGAVVQLVRIHACHAVGREFESRPHRSQPTIKRRGSPLFLLKCCPVCLGSNWRSFETKGNGPLAQLNRVPHYGCGGCRFESCMDHIATQKSRCFSAAFFVLQINNHFFDGLLLLLLLLRRRSRLLAMLARNRGKTFYSNRNYQRIHLYKERITYLILPWSTHSVRWPIPFYGSA